MSNSVTRTPLARLRHDLRTPLNAIIGYSEVLSEELGEGIRAEVRAALRLASASGHRLLGSVTRVLAEVEHETGGTLPEGLHLRMARAMAHDVDLLRELTTLLREDGTSIEDVDRLDRAIDQLWSYCSGSSFVEASPQRAPVGVASPTTAPRPPVVVGRVLVVDDLPENRTLLQRRLQLMGHTTRLASGGEEALHVLANESVDLVLLDVLMPGMDGLEVLQRIRQDPLTRDLPVVMLSAMDNDENVVRCIELGADDFVAKPFNPVFLRARVGASLEKKRLRDAEVEARGALDTERARVEDLLRVILPEEVVAELKATGSVRPRRYENVAVLFCDVVDFTRWCDQHEPEEVVTKLRALVERLEDVCARYGLQKIKTIGDSFMAVAGMLRASETPALDCVRAGLEMVRQTDGLDWQVRVGIHAGPVVAGVVGRSQYLFDLWGDTVNTAARVEAAGESGAVCVSEQVWEVVGASCTGTALAPIEMKGKGRLARWRVEGIGP